MSGLKIGKNTIKILLLALTIVLAIMLLVSAWGGCVDPHSSKLLPLLTLALPIVLMVNLVVALIWCLFLRWRYALIPIAAVVFSWQPVNTVCPLNVFASTESATDSAKIKVISFNTMNFGPYDPSNHEPSKSMRYILDQDADFVLIQEGSQERDYLQLSNVRMMREELESKYPYHSDGNRDLMLLSKYPYTVVPDTAMKRGPGSVNIPGSRYHYFAKAFDISLPNGKQLRLMTTHLQSVGLQQSAKDLYMKMTESEIGSSKRELKQIKHSLIDKLNSAFRYRADEAKKLRSFLDKCPENVILCGDFNDTPSSFCYRTVRGDDMNDTFVDCGFGFTHTYHDNRFYFKIDHILYRGSLKAVSWQRDKAGDSDHYPQVATFVWK